MEFATATALELALGPAYEKTVILGQGAVVEPEPTAEFYNTEDAFVVNLVGGMEEGGLLSTVDADILKVATEDMYSDLIIPFEDQVITTLDPMAAPLFTESSDNWAPSPASTISEYTETTMYSPMASPTSPSSSCYDNYSPMSEASSTSEESITLVVAPQEVFGEQAPLKRKRGRKPKSETGEGSSKAKKAKKMKVYEINHPLEDKEKERKRLNAVNAKKHRDLQKQNKEALEQQLSDVKNERDGLKKEVETLREKEQSLTQQLEVFKKHFGKQALSVVSLLQAGQVSF